MNLGRQAQDSESLFIHLAQPDAAQEAAQNDATPPPSPSPADTEEPQPDTPPSAPADAEAQEPAPPQAEPTVTGNAPAETFESCWTQMVDAVFAKKPAFYHQLRDHMPRFENETVHVDVENDFQKNQLEMSKRAMLEYWRNQFELNVNDIEFVIHEHERKKVIYTSEDKVNNMLEQNPELKDFLQVLNFRIKD